MKKVISISIDEEVLDVIKKKATKKHETVSRRIEETLRKALRLWFVNVANVELSLKLPDNTL